MFKNKSECLQLMDDIENCLVTDLDVSLTSKLSFAQQKRDHIKSRYQACMDKFRNDANRYCKLAPEYLV